MTCYCLKHLVSNSLHLSGSTSAIQPRNWPTHHLNQWLFTDDPRTFAFLDCLLLLLTVLVDAIMIHNNEIVSIEEVLIKSLQQLPNQRQLTRKFIFTNRSTNLKLRVSCLTASVDSCEIDNHKIIVGSENEEIINYNDARESQWTPHVLAFERILSMSFEETQQKQLTYQLTKENEFIIVGKGFNSILPSGLMNPSFINLVCHL